MKHNIIHPKKVALFDVCQTLVPVTTISDFTSRYLLSRELNSHFSWRAYGSHIAYRVLNKIGLRNVPQSRAHMAALFAGYSKKDLEASAQSYAQWLFHNVKKDVWDALVALKQKETEIILVSAGFDVYLTHFAKAIGATLVCTVLEVDAHGKYTGKIQGVDCIGVGKVSKLREMLPDFDAIDWKNSTAFGDEFSDIPMLGLVGTPCAVDPDMKLEKYARTHAWKILSTHRSKKHTDPTYLIRLDDACETMHREKWDRIERLLDMYHVKPLVGVIPQNKDSSFLYQTADPYFWNTVKKWERKGWSIGMHGYEHVYTTTNGGLVPIRHRSEFAGVPKNMQQEKIQKAWDIFVTQGIVPKYWVAPGHSFDAETLCALQACTNIRVVSDGISFCSFTQAGFLWIPVQLWKFRKFPFGTYTICLHPNTMQENDFLQLEKALKHNTTLFSSFDVVSLQKPQRSYGLHTLFAIGWWSIYSIKKVFAKKT